MAQAVITNQGLVLKPGAGYLFTKLGGPYAHEPGDHGWTEAQAIVSPTGNRRLW